VLRTYGISGLQKYIRHHCQLAKRFERLVRSDNKYEVLNDVKVINIITIIDIPIKFNILPLHKIILFPLKNRWG